MKRSCIVFGLGLVLAAAAPLLAHHSFAAEFDASKEVKITGKVTKVEWMNPHAWFYLDALEVCEGPAGSERNKTWTCTKNVAPRAAEWAFELASPNGLMRQGWTRNSMKVGDSLTVEGTRSKDGGSRGNARVVMMGDGRRLFAGSSQGATQ